MSKEPIQPQDKYVLRFPDGLRDRIKRSAEANNRSMNAEIISRIEESLDDDLVAQRMRERSFNRDRTIVYVILDSDGAPLSWPDISIHLGQFSKAAGGKLSRLDAVVLAPSSDPAEHDEWERYQAIAKKYREYGKGGSVAATLREAAPDMGSESAPMDFTFTRE